MLQTILRVRMQRSITTTYINQEQNDVDNTSDTSRAYVSIRRITEVVCYRVCISFFYRTRIVGINDRSLSISVLINSLMVLKMKAGFDTKMLDQIQLKHASK